MILSMMFPCNTHTQQEYWEKRIRSNKNPLYHEMLKRKLAELEYREKHAVTKQFFLQVFFVDDNERKESIRLIDSILGIIQEKERRTGMEMLEEIPEKKKTALGVRGIKLSDNDTVEEVYLLNKNGETVITYNDKAISLNKLKLGHRDTKGTKLRI